MKRLASALAAALAAVTDARAVSLNPEGLGQALIYPYYTVRSAEGNAYNTYLSVVNHSGDAKALRVRFREGRGGREVASFNLYLSPNDVWTGAVVPTDAGARLITRDVSCTEPGFLMGFADAFSHLEFRNNAYEGSVDDGLGNGLDRTREGYVELLEMAVLTGDARDSVIHRATGAPADCGVIRANASPSVTAPSGQLSGTLTLINVGSGLDFTVNAEALADVASRPYFRRASDPYPDFAAAEIDPVSIVSDGTSVYRSVWNRGVDAVTAAFMRSAFHVEYVLDPDSSSLTDVVATLPTRAYHLADSPVSPPFTALVSGTSPCSRGEPLSVTAYNREEAATTSAGTDIPGAPVPPKLMCAATAVGSVISGAAHIPSTAGNSLVLGSATRGLFTSGTYPARPNFHNGWLRIVPSSTGHQILSRPNSIRVDLANGQMTTGSHRYFGLPVVGFSARTFRNGLLSCAAGRCQGNYGGAFPLKFQRTIN